jgi:predicted nucleic acid-binding protein
MWIDSTIRIRSALSAPLSADRAKDIVLGLDRLSARDAIHIAIVEHYRIDAILSFDRGFDASRPEAPVPLASRVVGSVL